MNYTIIFVNTVFFSSINQVTLSLCGLLDTFSWYCLVWYRDSRKIYLKLLLTSFNHVINVMDVYTQSNQKYFSLSGIIKLLYNCFPWKLNVRVALSAQFSKYNRYSDTSFLFTSSNVSQRWMWWSCRSSGAI
jgi:hypothetical protein